jgi:hypothetical protein
LQSENRCTKIKEKYFINNASKRKMHKIKEKYFISKCYLKTDAPKCA